MSYLDVGERSVTIGDQATRDYLRQTGQDVGTIYSSSRTSTDAERASNASVFGVPIDRDAMMRRGVSSESANAAVDAVSSLNEAVSNFNPVEWFKRLIAVGIGGGLIITGLIMSKSNPVGLIQKVVSK